MKRFHNNIWMLVFLFIPQNLLSQVWLTEFDIPEGRTMTPAECFSADNGSAMLAVGRTSESSDYTRYCKGVVAKVDADGNSVMREIQVEGMDMKYLCGTQLDNGGFIVFGLYDDSLHADTSLYQRYLRADVFDNELNLLHTKTFRTDVGGYGGIYHDDPFRNGHLWCAKNDVGNVVLVSEPAYFLSIPPGGMFMQDFRFYEFNDMGDTLRSNTIFIESGVGPVDRLFKTQNELACLTYAGNGEAYWIVDSNLNVEKKFSIKPIHNGVVCSDARCDGHWYDGNQLIIDMEWHTGTGNDVLYQHSLHKYKLDSNCQLIAELHLPCADSTNWAPYSVNTAYVNDSTIFAITYSGSWWAANDTYQLNITLVDKDLNLLGRKVIKKQDYCFVCDQPVPLYPNGCFLPIDLFSGSNYQGEGFQRYEVLPVFRDEIVITWDVVDEHQNVETYGTAFPNPTNGTLNIPVEGITPDVSRIQIFNVIGQKCLDSNIGKNGNLITIDTQNLEAGTYLYQVVSADRILTKGKFVKE